MPETVDCDVLIVGTGPVGAIYARYLADAGLRVLMVDAGAATSLPAGGHLRNDYLHQRDLRSYHDAIAARLYPLSLPAASRPLKLGGAAMPPRASRGNNLNPEQVAARNLPAAAACYAVGGMGTVWTCLAPRFHPALERWDLIPDRQWDVLYALAEDALGVRSDLFDDSVRQRVLLEILAQDHPSTHPAPSPVAASRRAGGGDLIRWTGPREILGNRLQGGGLEILPQHVVQRLEHRGGKVLWAQVQGLGPWRERRIRAETFVVAAGAVATPQLLWHSRIARDEPSALGRYLCDHPLAFAQAALLPRVLDEIRRLTGSRESVPIPPADPDPFLALPLSEGRPFHSLILSGPYDRRLLEESLDERLLLNFYWYSRVQPRRDNRVTFNDELRDLHGLPKPTFHYSLEAGDREVVDRTLQDLRQIGGSIGTFLPMAPPQLLAAGSSMHTLGTTRMGRADDGDSVVDAGGRVWGFSNLYLGGTGVVPSATASNPTLTACAVAIRSALEILGREVPQPAPPVSR